MTDSSMQLILDDDRAEIGGSFRGRLLRMGVLDDLSGGGGSRVRGVRLELEYRTEGRATTDTKVVATEEYPIDDYGRVDAAFALEVPSAGPISYDGRLIRVLWRVKAQLDIRLGRDEKLEVPVLVLPRHGWGLYQRPHPLHR